MSVQKQPWQSYYWWKTNLLAHFLLSAWLWVVLFWLLPCFCLLLWAAFLLRWVLLASKAVLLPAWSPSARRWKCCCKHSIHLSLLWHSLAKWECAKQFIQYLCLFTMLNRLKEPMWRNLGHFRNGWCSEHNRRLALETAITSSGLLFFGRSAASQRGASSNIS